MVKAVVADTAPLKVILPVVLVRARVPTLTAPLKVAPPELVSVNTFKGWLPPMAPLTDTAPVVFNVKSVVVPPLVVALTVLKLIALAMPVPIVKVVLLAIVVAPKVIAPVEVPPTFAVSVVVTGAPRLMTPVPAAVTVPAKLIAEGAVAITPPVKALVIEDELPKVNVPVFKKVVVPAIVLPAFKATL